MKTTPRIHRPHPFGRLGILLALPLLLAGANAPGQSRFRVAPKVTEEIAEDANRPTRPATGRTPNVRTPVPRRPVTPVPGPRIPSSGVPTGSGGILRPGQIGKEQIVSTTLKTRLNHGDIASPWTTSLNINGTETVQFLWTTTGRGAVDGRWEVLSTSGQLLARGNTRHAPLPGKASVFNIDFGTMPKMKNYRVRVRPLFNPTRRKVASSAPVSIVRLGPNIPTEFTPEGLWGGLDEETEKIRRKYNVPALGGAVVTEKGVIAISAAGVRKHGDRIPVSHSDKWHLGSDTKAMTAALITVMIAKDAVPGNRLSWATTVADVYPEFREKMHPDFRRVNLEALLAHRSGLTNPNSDENAALRDSDLSVMARRYKFTMLITSRDHSGVIGETYSYQNGNTIIAGAMLEKLTGKSWETLMREYLFQPLGMHSAGFGSPAGSGRPLQPWGHTDGSGHRVPTLEDNAAALGPAGTVHASLSDWAKFLKFQFTGSEGNLHLSQARIRAIQRAYPAGDMVNYGFGWGIGRDSNLGLQLSHDGSNTRWYCHTQVFPEKKIAYLTVSNIGGDVKDGAGRLISDNGNGDQACFALRNHLRKRYKP